MPHQVPILHPKHQAIILYEHDCKPTIFQPSPPTTLTTMVLANSLKGKPLPICGSGIQVRDWLYVGDHASTLYKVITEGIVEFYKKMKMISIEEKPMNHYILQRRPTQKMLCYYTFPQTIFLMKKQQAHTQKP